MGKLFRNIVGLACVAAGIASAGADRQSQQLHCQKVAPQVANCRAAIKTLAGWGGSIENFADVRSAKVALVTGKGKSTQRSKYAAQTTTVTYYYPVLLTDRAGKSSPIRSMSQNYEPASMSIADQVNQFIRSAEMKTTIDLSETGWSWIYTESGNITGGQGPVPHGAWIFAGLFGGIGLVLLSWPWWVSRFWPWWLMRRMNPELRSLLESQEGSDR
jgi:hypothetical protein